MLWNKELVSCLDVSAVPSVSLLPSLFSLFLPLSLSPSWLMTLPLSLYFCIYVSISFCFCPSCREVLSLLLSPCDLVPPCDLHVSPLFMRDASKSSDLRPT